MPDQKVYLRQANELTMTFAMIETRTALDNVEAIAATPGIDALFLGPADLSIALSNGANVDPMARRSTARSTASPPPLPRPARSWERIVIAPSARSPSPHAACGSSRSAATWASFAPGPRR